MKCLTFMIICAAGIAAILSPLAEADPSNAASSRVMQLVCSGQSITVVGNGNGIFSPVHDVANTSTFTPKALNVVLTFTPADGGSPSSDHAIVGKAAPIQDAVECTIPLQTLDSGPAGVQTIEGSITGFWTPR
jgi:hypothetical protein